MPSRIMLSVPLLLVLVACKSQGTVTVSVDVPGECPAATHVQAYFVYGGLCDDCICGDCLQKCTGDNCTEGCPDGPCPIEALDTGLESEPSRPGNYAVIYQLLHIDAGGRIELVASACADGLQLDKDGTSDSSISAVGTCCPVTSP